jgi:sugar lactone lactonase YvrE
VPGAPVIWGLAVDGERKRLYLAAGPLDAVQMINLQVDPPRLGDFLTGVPMVNDLALDFEGNLYYSQQKQKQVFRATPSGQTSLVTVDPVTNDLGEMVRPAGLAFGPEGDLFLGNYGSTIVRLPLAGGKALARHRFGNTYPWGNGLAFDVRGRLYVADYWHGERSILRFDPDGSRFTAVGSGTRLSGMVFGRGALDCRDLYVASAAAPLQRLRTDTAGLPVP